MLLLSAVLGRLVSSVMRQRQACHLLCRDTLLAVGFFKWPSKCSLSVALPALAPAPVHSTGRLPAPNP